MKTCTKCRNELDRDKFPPDKRAPDGKQARCRACINAWMKEHFHNNPAPHMLRRARARATHKGLVFSITLDDLLPLPTHCPVFGTRLTRGNGKQDPFAFSLDRIDNSKGYVPGNVKVVSYRANRLKNDATVEELRRIADWMEECKPMTILEEARRLLKRHPAAELRLGQAVYTVAYLRNPAAAAHLAGTEFDPFHDDTRVNAFLEKIGEKPAT